MKIRNYLIATTALFGTVMCANAEPAALTNFKKPSITMSGKVSAFAFGTSVKQKVDGLPNVTGGSKGNLRFEAATSDDAGTEYGAIAEIDLRRDRVKSENFWRAVYVFASSERFGTWQLGELDGALMQTIVDGRNLLGGTGGFDGDMWYAVTASTGVMSSYLPATYTKYATKMVYKSPTVRGAQFVVSYTPQSKLYGLLNRTVGEGYSKQIGGAGEFSPSQAKVVEAALSYGFSVGEVGVNLYAGGAVSNPNSAQAKVDGTMTPYNYNSTKAMQFGMLLDWRKFQFAAGMINNQYSFKNQNDVGNAGTAYNTAVSYTTGPHAVAVGYMGSTRRVVGGNAKANVGSLTYEYTLAPGWNVFGEANYFKTTNTKEYYEQKGVTNLDQAPYMYTTGLDKNNSGAAFLIGSTVRF